MKKDSKKFLKVKIGFIGKMIEGSSGNNLNINVINKKADLLAQKVLGYKATRRALNQKSAKVPAPGQTEQKA